MKNTKFILWLSDSAYAGLVDRARECNYVRSKEGLGGTPALKAKGMSDYLLHLIHTNPFPDLWRDTRPAHLQEYTLDELENGVFPTWDDGEMRRPRELRWADDPLPFNEFKERVMELAKSFGCVHTHPKFGAGRALSPSQLISQWFESTGLGWLTPYRQPPHKEHKSKPRVQHTELDW